MIKPYVCYISASDYIIKSKLNLHTSQWQDYVLWSINIIIQSMGIYDVTHTLLKRWYIIEWWSQTENKNKLRIVYGSKNKATWSNSF